MREFLRYNQTRVLLKLALEQGLKLIFLENSAYKDSIRALPGEKIVAPMEYNGTMDSLLFETWFEHNFRECLNERQCDIINLLRK